MEEMPLNYTNEQLSTHAVVRSIISRCTAATRQWIAGELTREYLAELNGLAGVCISLARDSGLDGHHSGSSEERRQADALLSQLVEVRGLLRYPSYAAASLASDPALVDSPETRRVLVEQHIQTEPGQSFPSP
ncbi:hypothetical protein N9N28_15460 [Rubripirellula amarantea]|nr:hypothetical protein [Rubripirellula amarantea]